MSIYIVRLRETDDTSNALISSKHLHFQVPPKMFRLDDWMAPRIWQRVPYHRAGDWDATWEAWLEH